jgi:hypothetical protein
MSVAVYNGVSASCNLCGKIGPILRYDGQRYRQPNYQDYTDGLNSKALRAALQEGFIVIERMLPDGAGNFVHNDMHVCPVCVDEVKFATEPKKPKSKKNGSLRKKLT